MQEVKTGTETKGQRSGPRSVERLLNVLYVLAVAQESVSLAQLSYDTATPKTSLLALLRALVKAEYVVRLEAGYALGAKAFALGSAIIGQRKLTQLARPILQRLAENSGETILLAELCEDGTHAVYIDKVESNRAIRFDANVGDRRPLYGSAAGRALLAFQDPGIRDEYIAKVKLQPLIRSKKLTRRELVGILNDVKKNRLAVTSGDVTEGVAGFASPIFGRDGELVAAVAIGAPIERGATNSKLFSELVVHGAKEISKILGRIEQD